MRMIYHFPRSVDAPGARGSSVRPYRMLAAFRDIADDVRVVTGSKRERLVIVDSLKAELKLGARFDFCYSEATTNPVILSEPSAVSPRPLLDLDFYRAVRRAGIPIGLFYRDIHWRFPHYRKRAGWKSALTVPLFRADGHFFRRTIATIFLPSMRMQQWLPRSLRDLPATPLPPGCEGRGGSPPSRVREPGRPLSLLYVGGIEPPNYDLRPLLRALQGMNGVRLTLVCREDEWSARRSYYREAGMGNTRVVHASGGDLAPLYAQADLFMIYRASHPYLEFTMPLKLFEALEHGIPIICSDGNAVADFVREEMVGWVARTPTDMRDLLHRLEDHPTMLLEAGRQIARQRPRHTWIERALTAARTLAPSPG